MNELVEDLLLEMRALDWKVDNIYERGPARPDYKFDDMEKHWNVRIRRQNWSAFGSAESLPEALRLAIDDIPLAMIYHVPVKHSPPRSGPSLEDLGL